MTPSSRLFLEDFGSGSVQPATSPASASVPAQPAAAPDTTEIYEKGYKAGWDDCLEGSKNEQKHIAEAFGRRLGEAELTILQTRAALLGGLKPLLSDVVQKLLPALAQTGFRQQLVDEIIQLADTATEVKIEVRVSEEDLGAVTSLLEAHPDVPEVSLSGDPALGLTQAHIKLGSTGKSVDILNVVDGIEQAFDAILNEEKEMTLG